MSDLITDIRNRDDIRRFVTMFYQSIQEDPVLAPIFFDVAKINLLNHLDRIVAYWDKMLFADFEYQGNMIQKHLNIHRLQVFKEAHFERWLTLFISSVTALFRGPVADRACLLGKRIAKNMSVYLNSELVNS